ncbi:tail tape measure protein [Rhodobacter sp. NSM]|uniref:tail tape measure protein n=1 Tax=Rhodobacter sp. NSM TaxID=3457501 RepID=UPI003FD2B78E
MSASVIGALRVNLGLDSAQFQAGLKKAQSSLGDAAKAFGALSAIGATVGAAMAAIVAPTARAANEVSRLSQVANTTPQTLQRWSAASKTVGIEQEKLADILKDVNDKVGDFLSTGGGEMKDFFEKIAPRVGVTADQFRKLSGPQALQLYVSSLERAGVSQAQMTFYMEAIANDATLLLPLLRNNGAEMERLGAAAAGLGVILSDDAVAALRDAHLALGQMSTAIQGARDRMAAELAPAVEAMAVAFTNSMREGGALRTVLDGLGSVIGALADQTGRIASYLGTAAVAGAIAFRGAIYAAATATWGFVSALVATRAALIRTGLGIAVVAVGELVYQMTRAVEATGSVGRAFQWMGNIAVAAAYKFEAAFLRAINTVLGSFAEMTWSIAEELNKLFQTDMFSGVLWPPRGASRNTITMDLENAADAADAAAAAAQAAADALVNVEDAADGAAPSVAGLGEGVSDLGDSAGGARKKLSELVNAAKEWKERLKTPVEKYREEIGKLGELLKKGLLNSDEYQRAIGELNKELGDGIPLINDVATAWGDFVTGGFKDFKGFVSSVLGSFKSMLAEMIATAARNRIVLGLGLGASGSVAGAAGAAVTGGAGGMVGGIGNLLGLGGSFGRIGGALSAFGTGAWGALSNFATGGLSGGLAYIGSSLSFATSGLAGFAQAAGAILGPIAAVAAAFSFFGTKTKLLDAGLRITVRELDAMVETFKKVEKSKFWGLSKSTSVTYDTASAEVANPILKAIGEMQTAILETADALGVGRNAFDDFAASVKFSTKGLSDEEIGAKLQEKLTELGDDFAARAFGYVGVNDQAIKDLEERIANGTVEALFTGTSVFGERIAQMFAQRRANTDLASLIANNDLVSTDATLAALVHEGEGFAAALQRLMTSMQGVNAIMDTLGHTFKAVDMITAGVASDIADAFGGLEAMGQATSAYYQTFYTDAERLATTTRQVTEALADLNILMPATRAQYRALIEAQDLTTERGREVYAALIGMSGAMDQVLPQIDGMTAAISGMVDGVVSIVDDVIGRVTEINRAAAASARVWRTISDGLRSFVDAARRTAGDLISPAAALAQARRQYGAAVSATMRGNQDAGGAVAGLAGDYIAAARATAATSIDAARIQARVLAQVSALSDVTGAQASYEERIVRLGERQLAVLGELRDYLTSGVELDPATIARFAGRIGSIADRAAELTAAPISGLSTTLRTSLRGMGLDLTEGLGRVFESAMEGLDIGGPITSLRGHLLDLARAVRAETARARDQERRQAAISAAVNRVAAAEERARAADAQLRSAATAINEFDARTAGRLIDAAGNSVQATFDANGNLRFNPAAVSGAGAAIGEWRSEFWADGGLEDSLWDANRAARQARASLDRIMESAREAIRAAGGVPSFAAGGLHAGGMRLVGEQGPELEVTGPSRIYSASQTRDLLNTREMVTEMRAMREELARMRSENTQLALRIEQNTYTSASIARREERRTLSET